MFSIMTIGVTKPTIHMTFKNGWKVVGQFTSPQVDNGVHEAATVTINIHQPNDGHVQSLRALTLDELIVQLAIVQRR